MKKGAIWFALERLYLVKENTNFLIEHRSLYFLLPLSKGETFKLIKTMDLTSNYAGIELQNPIIAASSGMTATAEKIVQIAEAGVGAVVLKSLFEEQIESEALSSAAIDAYGEGTEYILQYTKSHKIEQHLNLIADAKARTSIPIIASINCYKKGEWISFARRMEQAGADAVELNIMRIETGKMVNENQLANEYIDMCTMVAKELSIPVAVKLDSQYSCLVALVDKLRASGIKGVTCFNRPYQMDIDLNKLQIIGGPMLTTEADLSTTLKFTGILSALVPGIAVSASGGVHSSEAVIKCLLAGASSVQLASSLYKKGVSVVTNYIKELKDWMTTKGYRTVDEFKGLLNAKNDKGKNSFERVQFMKYVSND